MSNGFGKYDVYAVAGSSYCYQDSNVLRNRYNIRGAKKLCAVEMDISAIRQNDLLLRPICGRFSSRHLCSIHQYLLGDIYFFAGHFRKEDIAKGTTRFLRHQDIGAKLKMTLDSLKKEKWLQNLDDEAKLKRFAYYFAELNYIHPFREGNGRALREFMRLLIEYNGYEVNWAAVSVEVLISAMVTSVFEIEPLILVLRSCLSKKQSF